MLYIAYISLDLVLRGNILPRGQKHALVHLSVLDEQHVHGHLAREVENVHVVLYRNLRNMEHVECVTYKKGG